MSEDQGIVGATQLANRRGFLLGITLAEILLIVLFVLLLLFRHYQVEATVLETVTDELGADAVTQFVEASNSTPSNKKMASKIEDIMTEMINCRNSKDPACQSDEKPAPKFPGDESDPDSSKTVDSGGKIGELTICTHEPPPPGTSEKKGRSISIGTFWIQEKGISLIQKNTQLRTLDIVDFVGDPYDASEAATELEDWPLMQKLSFDEFAVRGKRFVEIGDVETAKRVGCRFTANFYFEANEETFAAFNDSFMTYFFQTPPKISRTAFEAIMAPSN